MAVIPLSTTLTTITGTMAQPGTPTHHCKVDDYLENTLGAEPSACHSHGLRRLPTPGERQFDRLRPRDQGIRARLWWVDRLTRAQRMLNIHREAVGSEAALSIAFISGLAQACNFGSPRSIAISI